MCCFDTFMRCMMIRSGSLACAPFQTFVIAVGGMFKVLSEAKLKYTLGAGWLVQLVRVWC